MRLDSPRYILQSYENKAQAVVKVKLDRSRPARRCGRSGAAEWHERGD